MSEKHNPGRGRPELPAAKKLRNRAMVLFNDAEAKAVEELIARDLPGLGSKSEVMRRALRRLLKSYGTLPKENPAKNI